MLAPGATYVFAVEAAAAGADVVALGLSCGTDRRAWASVRVHVVSAPSLDAANATHSTTSNGAYVSTLVHPVTRPCSPGS